ncbi:hypothetical protein CAUPRSCDRAFT_12793, partial [Caulochytrium protostelioides]
MALYPRDAIPDRVDPGTVRTPPSEPLPDDVPYFGATPKQIAEFKSFIPDKSEYVTHLKRKSKNMLPRIALLYNLREKVRPVPGMIIPRFTSNNLLAPWWGAREDQDLLVGTIKHGYQSYPKIQFDPELVFLSHMPPEIQARVHKACARGSSSNADATAATDVVVAADTSVDVTAADGVKPTADAGPAVKAERDGSLAVAAVADSGGDVDADALAVPVKADVIMPDTIKPETGADAAKPEAAVTVLPVPMVTALKGQSLDGLKLKEPSSGLSSGASTTTDDGGATDLESEKQGT